jgi:hypothetical protein
MVERHWITPLLMLCSHPSRLVAIDAATPEKTLGKERRKKEKKRVEGRLPTPKSGAYRGLNDVFSRPFARPQNCLQNT